MSIDVNVQNDLVIVTESSEDITVNVSNAAGPAGVGVPVGGSTGQVLKKLSNTNYDTYWALDGGGVPYSGATGDVDLGEYELKAGQVEFDQTPTGTAGVGVMRWNDSDGTVDLGLKGGNVTLQVGQEQILRVVNKTGADLLESQYRAVRIRLAAEGGSQGQRLAVVLAQGNNDANSSDTIGIVTETITNNQEGFICTSGIVRGINTTGSLQGETWADGDIIYLSPAIPGAITKVKPTAPNHSVILGYVVYAHGVNGKIFVKCDNGYEIGELHDVYAPTPSNNDGIFWNSTNLRYENKTVAGALGFTPVPSTRTIGTTAPLTGGGDLSANRTLSIPAATTLVDGYLTATDWTTFNNKQNALGFTPVPTTRTLTINGTAYDLSADRSWTIAAGITGSGVAGQVAYWNGTGSQTGSNNLFWDTVTQGGLLVVKGAQGGFKIGNYSAVSGVGAIWNNSVTPTNTNFVLASSATDTGISSPSTISLSVNAQTYLRIASSGNVLLQNAGTFTDSGQRLQVQGTSLFADNLLVSKNQNAATTINITNTNNNANSYVAYEFQTTSYASLFKHSTSRTYKFVLGDDFGFYNGAGAGDIAILNDFSSGKIKFGAGGSSTPHLTINSNGSLLAASSITASSFIKSGGTSAQILAADGSVITAGTNITISGGTISASGGGGGTTIYTGDGTLTSARTLTHGGFNLSLVGSTFTNRFTAAGRLLLGTTTESTYLLDINGTARVSGQTTINAATSGTSAYTLSIIDNNPTNGTNLLMNFNGGESIIHKITASGGRIISSNSKNFLGFNFNSGNVVIGGNESGSNTDKLNIVGLNSATTDGCGITLYDTSPSGNTGAGINFSTPIGISASIRWTINGGYNNTGLRFIVNNNVGALTEVFRITETQNVLVGSTTNVPSAILAASSTTKGFLPPRGTNAQMLAIASPATGLMFYDTTNNKLNCYDGTTWQACW